MYTNYFWEESFKYLNSLNEKFTSRETQWDIKPLSCFQILRFLNELLKAGTEDLEIIMTNESVETIEKSVVLSKMEYSEKILEILNMS